MIVTQAQIDDTADRILKALGPEKALRLIDKDIRFSKYQDDPVGFGEQVLGESYTDDAKAMMESVRDYEITVAMSANAVGKSHGSARLAIWHYLCFPDSQTYTAAAPPEDNLRRILWGEIGDITAKHPELFVDHQVNLLNIQKSPRHFLSGVTIPMSGDAKTREARFSGKHAPYLMFVFDEGDAIPDEVYAGRESCTSGGKFRTLIMLNPRQMKGSVYRMVRDGHANVVHLSAFNHPNVISGQNIIPGAVDRNTTARRIVQMCRPLIEGEKTDSIDTFDLPDYLAGYQAQDQKGELLDPLVPGKYHVTDSAFSHMVLGRYPSQADNQLISVDWINRARERWQLWVQRFGEVAPAYVEPIAGLDVGELGNDPSVWCARYGGYLTRFKEWTGVDTVFTGDRSIELARESLIKCTMVDGNGVGAGVAPHMMRKGYAARGVKTQESPDDRELAPDLGEFKILRDQLAWQVREWLRTDPNAMIPPDEELIEELSIPTYSVEGRFVKLMKADVYKDLLKRSPNKFSALCLTFAKMLDVGGVNTAAAVSQHKQLKAKYSRWGRS